MGTSTACDTDTLVGWKQIASYLGVHARTAIRWNRELRLPVCTSSEFGVVWARVPWIREWQDKHKPFQRKPSQEQQEALPAPRLTA